MSEALIHGRRIVLAHATYTLYDEWSDGEVTWGDITAPMYFSTALAAFMISDPEIRSLGWLLPSKTPHLILAWTAHRILEDSGYYESDVMIEKLERSTVSDLVTILPDWMLSEKGKQQKREQPTYHFLLWGLRGISYGKRKVIQAKEKWSSKVVPHWSIPNLGV